MRRIAALALSATVSLALLAGSASSTSRQLRVAYITDVVTPAGPHTLRGVALLGFQRAVKDFAVQGRVVQFDPSRGPGPTLASLARQKYDLVITGQAQSFEDVDAVIAVARRFPKSRFVMSDPPVLKPWPRNVQGSVWLVEQSSYLAGDLAALMERRRPGRDVVGAVGGLPISLVDSFIAGYQAGAKKADPGITTLRGYAGSFFDSAKCKAVALAQIAKGAGALLNVGGSCGLGTLQAAKQKRIWGIGVDVDQSFLGRHILTSVLKRFDVEVYATVEALVRGKLHTGGNKIWSLRNGGVGLGRISPKVPPPFVRQVDRIRKQIIAGEIKVPSTLT